MKSHHVLLLQKKVRGIRHEKYERLREKKAQIGLSVDSPPADKTGRPQGKTKGGTKGGGSPCRKKKKKKREATRG